MTIVILGATLQHSSRTLLKSCVGDIWQKSANNAIKYILLFTSFLPTLIPHFISFRGREGVREVLKSCGVIGASAHE